MDTVNFVTGLFLAWALGFGVLSVSIWVVNSTLTDILTKLEESEETRRRVLECSKRQLDVKKATWGEGGDVIRARLLERLNKK